MGYALFSAPKWSFEEITMENFLKKLNTIDVDPVGQRPSVEPSHTGTDRSPSKSQGIISSILYGNDIGEVSVVRNHTGEVYPFESVDGSNRSRAILAFVHNKFCVHKTMPKIGGKFFSELDKEVQKKFMEYRLRLVTYESMSNYQKGLTFRQRNFSTSVNHQEMLNSFGRTPVATYVRNTARVVPRENNVVHPLFDHTISSSDDTPRFKYLSFANKRLDHDERVARILYLIWNDEKLDVCDKAQLEELYSAEISEDEMRPLANKTNLCLNFIHSIAYARKRLKNVGLSQSEFTMLMRLWFFFREKYGNFKLVDSESFYKKFDKAMLKFTSKDDTKLLSETIKDGQEVRLIHEAFRGYLTVHTSKRKAVDSCVWLTEKAGFDPLSDGSISILDTKRLFSNADIAEKLAEQDYKCWVTGQNLTMKNAQGAHIIPHSKGGKTDRDNLVVVSAEHNRKMGEMNAYDYRDLYMNQEVRLSA